MEANSSSLDNSVLLYVIVPDIYDQVVEHQITHVIDDVTLVEQDTQLKQILKQDNPQVLIVIGNPIVETLYDMLNAKQIKNLITIHVTDDPMDINIPTPFDFTLINDSSLKYHLEQILRYKQRQSVVSQQLQRRIKDLESQLRNEKQHSNQIEILKEAIVRNVSHELKTPLLHVKSAVSLMAEDMGKDNKLIRYAENATARLETLVTNITMFGSSLDLNLGPVIVRDAMEYAHRNLRRIWESKEHAKRIRLYIDDHLPPVRADRQGLSTILQLLLDNALKFSEGEIEVHAHRIGDEIEIAVKDYGIGIDPDHLNSIFDSFYQIDPSSTRRYGGTGVGLALVKLLTEKHMSTIEVQSEVNKGSTFSFRLQIIIFE